MPDNKFTLKESDRIIADIIDEYFDQHNMNYDMKELVKSGMLGAMPEPMPDLGLGGEQNV